MLKPMLAPNTGQQGLDRRLSRAVSSPRNIFDNKAGDSARPLCPNGGPVALMKQLGKFFIGINDPWGQNPTGKPFDPNIFNLYPSPLWSGFQGNADDETGPMATHGRSIANGQRLFNTTPINITGVAGLNDVLNTPSIPGFLRHLSRHSRRRRSFGQGALEHRHCQRRGQRPAGARHFRIAGIHAYMQRAVRLSGHVFMVTDPGRALISGNCADIGKVQRPDFAWAGRASAVLPQRRGRNADLMSSTFTFSASHRFHRSRKSRTW